MQLQQFCLTEPGQLIQVCNPDLSEGLPCGIFWSERPLIAWFFSGFSLVHLHLLEIWQPWDIFQRAGCGVMSKSPSCFDKLALCRTADDQLLRSIAGKFLFIVAAVLVLNHKTVIPEQGINFLWKKLPHLE